MNLIDSHTHIYLPEFDGDRQAVLQRAKDVGVAYLLMPAIDSTTHKAMIDLESENANCLAMIGLHPCSVTTNYHDELQIVRDYLNRRKFIAIGEIGLDFYWDKTFTEQQYEAFHEQVKLAIQMDLPIVIHSRNATAECIEVVRNYPGIKGVFHCFSGTYEQARDIIDLGIFLGIGGVITFKNAGLDKVIASTGLTHVILETDAPYLAPVPYRGKRNEPAYTALVAEKLALVCDLTVDEVAELTSENSRNLFKLARKQ